ncbi:MAG: SHIRT domain-containing protein [Eubacterium sp.]
MKRLGITFCMTMMIFMNLGMGVNGEAVRAESLAFTSYLSQTYGVPYTEKDANGSAADRDQDGKLTYMLPSNGYKAATKTITETIINERGCQEDQITTVYTDGVEFNARSVMDPNLDDYSNNGYFEKVYNPRNHHVNSDNAELAATFGPGNLEVQHWQDAGISQTQVQFWRIVFASDYAMDNVVMTITLPYDDTTNSDTTDWVINRYYPAVNGGGRYTQAMQGKSITINGNIATIEFGNIPSDSAYGITFTKRFDPPADFSEDKKVTAAKVTGQWNEEGLRLALEAKKEKMRAEGASPEEISAATLDYMKMPQSIESIRYENEVCPRRFDVIHHFVSKTEGKVLPPDVLAILPLKQTGKTVGTEVHATAPSQNAVQVEDGIWRFKGYDREKDIIGDQDVEFVGYWEFEPAATKYLATETKDKQVNNDVKTGITRDHWGLILLPILLAAVVAYPVIKKIKGI